LKFVSVFGWTVAVLFSVIDSTLVILLDSHFVLFMLTFSLQLHFREHVYLVAIVSSAWHHRAFFFLEKIRMSLLEHNCTWNGGTYARECKQGREEKS